MLLNATFFPFLESFSFLNKNNKITIFPKQNNNLISMSAMGEVANWNNFKKMHC